MRSLVFLPLAYSELVEIHTYVAVYTYTRLHMRPARSRYFTSVVFRIKSFFVTIFSFVLSFVRTIFFFPITRRASQIDATKYMKLDLIAESPIRFPRRKTMIEKRTKGQTEKVTCARIGVTG